MCYLQEVKVTEKENWDRIVKSFKNYDVGYLNAYAHAFMIKGDGEPRLLYYNDGNKKAVNVIMVRDVADADILHGKIPPNTYFDISSPYGYGGFWSEGGNYDDVIIEYECYCKEQGFISEFVRFHLLTDYKDHFRGTVETHTHNIIRPLQADLDVITADFEHKVRKNLKKAERSGLKIEIDTQGDTLEGFLDIYYNTMERTGAKKEFFFAKEIFEAINQMKGNFAYFNVIYEDTVVSTELVVYGSENCYSFLGGTLHDYFSLRPNEFLKFEIIKWAKGMGLKHFILGGGYGSDDGIFHYKKSLSPNGVYNFYIGKKVYDTERYKYLEELRRADEAVLDENYFPIYRAAIKTENEPEKQQGEEK